MPRPRFDRLEPARRDAIFDAAAAEFGEHGFERASYNRIIERAGLSKGAMYYYFDDKRDLFVTVIDETCGRLFDELESIGEVGGVEEYWARFRELSASTWARMLTEPRLMQLMPALLDPRNTADVPEVEQVVNERAAVWIQELMRQGRAVGAVRDDLPDDLMIAVTLSVGTSIDRWIAQRLMKAPSGGADGSEGADGADGPDGPDVPAELPEEIIDTVIDLMRRLLAPA